MKYRMIILAALALTMGCSNNVDQRPLTDTERELNENWAGYTAQERVDACEAYRLLGEARIAEEFGAENPESTSAIIILFREECP